MKYSINILPGGLCSIDQKAFQTILNSNYNYMLCNATRIAMDLSIARDNATKTTLFGNAKKLKYSGLITNETLEQVMTAKKTPSNIKLAIYEGIVSLTLKPGFDGII